MRPVKIDLDHSMEKSEHTPFHGAMAGNCTGPEADFVDCFLQQKGVAYRRVPKRASLSAESQSTQGVDDCVGEPNIGKFGRDPQQKPFSYEDQPD